MNLLRWIRNRIANLLGYKQGLVFKKGIPIGVRDGFRLYRSGFVGYAGIGLGKAHRIAPTMEEVGEALLEVGRKATSPPIDDKK